MKSRKFILSFGSFSLIAALSVPALADQVLPVGISAPMSGAAATWGLGQQWSGEQAAKEINEAGGVKIKGVTYKFKVIALDNKYNAADGTKVAQALVNQDHVKYIIGAIGTAPVAALQSLTERSDVLLFSSAWGKSTKGPKFPLTFTQSNTPFEILPVLYKYVKEKHPNIKTVAFINPNDATGQETYAVAKHAWEDQGVKTVETSWYERGTTQFQSIAAKLTQAKPDVIDLGVAPPGDAGVIMSQLQTLGWKGVAVSPVGTGAQQLANIGKDAVNGLYMGFAADFGSPTATPKERALEAGLLKALHENMGPLQIAPYDSLYALVAGMKAADSIDPKEIAKALPKTTFETSYGLTGFGGAKLYGSPQQMLLPVPITQIQDGKLVQLELAIPPELAQLRAAAGKSAAK